MAGDWWELTAIREMVEGIKYLIAGSGNLKMSVNYREIAKRSGTKVDEHSFSQQLMECSILCLTTFTGKHRKRLPTYTDLGKRASDGLHL